MKYIKGLVSVIIPTYKRPRLLERAIKSVLNQTYSYIECLVVNDNFPNDEYSKELYSLIDKYKFEKRLRLLDQVKHVNGAVARNYGIKFAKGEFIAFLDDDDYWNTKKLEYQVNFLNSHDETWGAVGCLTKQESNNILKSASLPYKTGVILREILCRKIGLGTGAVLIRRASLDESGYFDENLIRHQDLQLFSQLASKYKIGLVKKHLFTIEESSTINRPDPKKLVEIKESYYLSIEPILKTLPKHIVRRMHIMHDFEYGYALYKSGEKKKSYKFFLRLLKSPAAFVWSIDRVIRTIISRKLKNFIIRKYSKDVMD